MRSILVALNGAVPQLIFYQLYWPIISSFFYILSPLSSIGYED